MTLLEEVARRARRLSLMPASITQELFAWVPHANGANVRALSVRGRARLPPRWRRVKSINGVCMGEPIAIEVLRPDDNGAPLPGPSWVTIGTLISGEGPALAITGALGPTSLRQLQADDRWLLLDVDAKASVQATPAAVPPSTATPPRASKPTGTRGAPPPKKNVASSLPAVNEAIKNAAEGPSSTWTNLVKAPSAMFASNDASAKLMQIADVVRKAAGLPAAPPSSAPNEAQGSLAAVTKGITAVTNTAIQQTEAAKARARAQAALSAVQKGAGS